MLPDQKIKKIFPNILRPTAKDTMTIFQRPVFLNDSGKNPEVYSPSYETTEKEQKENENPTESFEKSAEQIQREIADVENRLKAMDKNNHQEYSRLVQMYNLLQQQYQLAKEQVCSQHAENLQQELEKLWQEQQSFERIDQQRRYQEEQENAKNFFVNTDLALNQEYPTQRSTTDPRFGSLKGRVQLQYFQADGKTVDLAAQERGDALNALPQYNPDGTPKEYQVEPPPNSGGRVRTLLWSENTPGKPLDGGSWIWKDESHLKPRRDARPHHGSYFSEIPKEPTAEKKPEMEGKTVAEKKTAAEEKTESRPAVEIIDTVLAEENSAEVAAIKEQEIEKIARTILEEIVNKPQSEDEKTIADTATVTGEKLSVSFQKFLSNIQEILEKPAPQTQKAKALEQEIALSMQPKDNIADRASKEVQSSKIPTPESSLPQTAASPEAEKTSPQKILAQVMEKITAAIKQPQKATPETRRHARQGIHFLNLISENVLKKTSEPNKNLTTEQLLAGAEKLSTADLLTVKAEYRQHEEEIAVFSQWKDLSKKNQNFEQILS